MDLAQFNRYCATLPATESVVQWGGAHVWKVGGKIFALCGPWGEGNSQKSPKICFKCSDLAFRILCEQPGIAPAPYLGRYKWVQLQQSDVLSQEDTQAYIEQAYQMVIEKLTKATRKKLGF